MALGAVALVLPQLIMMAIMTIVRSTRPSTSKKIDVDAGGEILELKTTVNQLSSAAAEVTGVGREVRSEGWLGGQAEVEGVQAPGSG